MIFETCWPDFLSFSTGLVIALQFKICVLLQVIEKVEHGYNRYIVGERILK